MKSFQNSSAVESYSSRLELVRKYSWAVPNKEAIEEIVKYSPIVEAGAGTGYWASLIKDAGGDIIALDKFPPGAGNNYYQHNSQYYPVVYGDAETIASYSERTLMLCWCPYDTDMGHDHIALYTGKTLILIGEGRGGCCGNDKMFDLIDVNFTFKKLIKIPQWAGIHDTLVIYTRNID